MLLYRNPPTPGDLVVRIVEALREAGVPCWIAGGWGVDALAERQTRVHRDLDLVIDARAGEAAVNALGAMGYHEWYRFETDRPLFSRIVLRDHVVAGRAVDLHPLDMSLEHVAFATGSIEGVPVPCLSVQSQVETHSNYRKRLRDRLDVATLRKVIEGSSTALIVPVPALDGLRDESVCEDGMPAHVTILHPFLRVRGIDEEIEEELGSLLAGISSFDFALSEIRSFPEVVYLAPEPPEPFVALTEAIVARWPEKPPYEGAFEEIVPHVSLAYGQTAPSGVSERLPIAAHAEEVWLMRKHGSGWQCARRFPLGPRGPEARD